jgi:hypothetical protein
VTHVTRFFTFPDCDRKHSLLNREEFLFFGKQSNVFPDTQYMWENASHASHPSHAGRCSKKARRHLA